MTDTPIFNALLREQESHLAYRLLAQANRRDAERAISIRALTQFRFPSIGPYDHVEPRRNSMILAGTNSILMQSAITVPERDQLHFRASSSDVWRIPGEIVERIESIRNNEPWWLDPNPDRIARYGEVGVWTDVRQRFAWPSGEDVVRDIVRKHEISAHRVRRFWKPVVICATAATLYTLLALYSSGVLK